MGQTNFAEADFLQWNALPVSKQGNILHEQTCSSKRLETNNIASMMVMLMRVSLP